MVTVSSADSKRAADELAASAEDGTKKVARLNAEGLSVQSRLPFDVGDWYLGPADGAIGRSNEKRKDFSEMMKSFLPSVPGTDRMKYTGELQLLEDHRTPTIVYSDLTDSTRWTCKGPGAGRGRHQRTHPQFEFTTPQHKVYVHLEDKSAGPVPRVLWDAIYDMGGTEWLKPDAQARGGKRPHMESFCPPINGPPHWYTLTISRLGNPARPRMLEDHLGTQVLTSYTSDHDPLINGLTTVMNWHNLLNQ